MSATSPVKPQTNPDPGHDNTTHKYNPDEKGVCIDCGWWDPDGGICPRCGRPVSEHEEELEELAKMIVFAILDDIKTKLAKRRNK